MAYYLPPLTNLNQSEAQIDWACDVVRDFTRPLE